MFSIVIPTWNNLAYLKLCIESLQKYSKFKHEILVHLNDGSDGSLEWIKSQGIKFSHTNKNIGVCMSVNHLVAQASHDWVVYMNDDMVAAPGWDTAFAEAIRSVNTDLALFFGTLIQPEDGGKRGIIKQDFGVSPDTFDEAGFLRHCQDGTHADREGSASQPTLVHKKWWSMVGGYSLEFSPGMSSDDDLLMKFCVAGCRNFRIVGNSRFYHFGCRSTGRIRHNLGGRTFVMKWGITQIEFLRLYLPSLVKPNGGNTDDNPSNCVRGSFLGKLRRVGYALRYNYPLEDIEEWDGKPAACEWGGYRKD